MCSHSSEWEQTIEETRFRFDPTFESGNKQQGNTESYNDPTVNSGPGEPLRLKRSAVLGPLFRVGQTKAGFDPLITELHSI